MDTIISIKGKVKYQITLDPGVWIFDDRRRDLNTYFELGHKENNEEDYARTASRHWDREIMEGAVKPPTLKSEIKFKNEKDLTGDLCIPLRPFLQNAEIEPDGKYFVIEGKNQDIEILLEDGLDLVLGFSKDGRPLKEDGPVHCYFGDGSNKKEPIKNVIGFRID